jgi:hypothetical protein
MDIDLTDGAGKGEDILARVASAALDDSANDLGLVRMELAMGTTMSTSHLDAVLASAIRTMRAAGQALAGGAAVITLAVAGLVFLPGATPHAAAMEAPQPDPTPVTLRVVLAGPVVTVRVPVSPRTYTAGFGWCASVWSRQGFAGRACSPYPSFTVVARLDARYVPVGRSTVQVTDDGDPLGTFPVAVTLDARRASKFGLGTWTDEGNGQVYISAPVRMYSPVAGRYVPQSAAPVRVQELVAGRWVTVATLVTNRYGIAGGYVTTGGGVFRMRVQRPQGATVTAVTGTTRTVAVTDEPLDVI